MLPAPSELVGEYTITPGIAAGSPPAIAILSYVIAP
jgi:hypothetical protein